MPPRMTILAVPRQRQTDTRNPVMYKIKINAIDGKRANSIFAEKSRTISPTTITQKKQKLPWM
jgi:hypothetical protein